jgi:hypothetical protein
MNKEKIKESSIRIKKELKNVSDAIKLSLFGINNYEEVTTHYHIVGTLNPSTRGAYSIRVFESDNVLKLKGDDNAVELIKIGSVLENDEGVRFVVSDYNPTVVSLHTFTYKEKEIELQVVTLVVQPYDNSKQNEETQSKFNELSQLSKKIDEFVSIIRPYVGGKKAKKYQQAYDDFAEIQKYIMKNDLNNKKVNKYKKELQKVDIELYNIFVSLFLS